MYSRYAFLNLIVLVVLALTGCSVARYVDVTTGPTATIVFKKNLQVASDALTYVDAKDCSGGRPRILTPSDPGDKEIKVPAGKEFSFTMDLDMTAYARNPGVNKFVLYAGCDPTVTFTPNAGVTYTAEVEIAASGSGCDFRLTQAVYSGGHLTAKPAIFTRRTYKRGLDDSSSWCY